MRIKLASAVVLFSTVAFAQTSTQKPVVTQKPVATAQAMTNDGVVKMVKAGLSEDLIIASIKNAAKKAFDVSPEGLIALKASGVPERIMMIMSGIDPPPVAASAPPATVAPATSAPAAKPETAAAPAPAREPGFYLLAVGQEVQLDPSVITGGKVGTFSAAMTGGIVKAKMKAVVRGARSNIRVRPTSGAIFVAGNGLLHPNELTIIRFKIDGGSRTFQVGEVGIMGAQEGIHDEYSVPFRAEKLSATTFKLVLDAPLPPGEYAFMSAALIQVSTSGVSGKLWDFGVDR